MRMLILGNLTDAFIWRERLCIGRWGRTPCCGAIKIVLAVIGPYCRMIAPHFLAPEQHGTIGAPVESELTIRAVAYDRRRCLQGNRRADPVKAAGCVKRAVELVIVITRRRWNVRRVRIETNRDSGS